MFKKIVIVEPVLITNDGKNELKKYCQELIEYKANTNSEEEIIKRIGDSDCVLVSYNTVISRNIIEKCPNIKHISLCCSYYGKQFAKVDITALEEKGITYSHLAEHGDNGVVEGTIAQTINILQGFNGIQLKKETLDLTNLNVGILGLGNLGTKVAKAYKFFGSNVYYYSRTRKERIEKELNITYLELDDLLEKVDVISINLNRDVCLIGGDKLDKFGNGKIVINSSIGKCYEYKTLKKWLQNKNNYYICDITTINEDIKDLLDYENVVYINHCIGDTKQCYLRASQQIVNNIKKASEKL